MVEHGYGAAYFSDNPKVHHLQITQRQRLDRKMEPGGWSLTTDLLPLAYAAGNCSTLSYPGKSLDKPSGQHLYLSRITLTERPKAEHDLVPGAGVQPASGRDDRFG